MKWLEWWAESWYGKQLYTNHDRSDFINQAQIPILYTAFLVATSIAWVLSFCGYLYVDQCFFQLLRLSITD